MKKILFGSIAVVLAVAFVSFTNAETKSNKFVCTWFVYDDPALSGSADFPSTLGDAKDQTKYRLLTGTETLAGLCPQTKNLCAICVDNTVVIGTTTRPVILGEVIEDEIDDYFAPGGNVITVVDNPNFIREKNQ